MQRVVADRPLLDEDMDELLGGDHQLVVLIATGGQDGLPHLTTADRVLPQPEGLVEVSGWLCSKTIHNLKHNPKLILMMHAGQGSVQIEGRVDTVEKDVTLDGHVRGEWEQPALPQSRWILRVHLQRFFQFSDGVHSDEPLGDGTDRLEP